MRKVLLAALLLMAPIAAWAVDISVNDVALKIPSPAGFSPVTAEMKPFEELRKIFVPATNEEFAAFIPDTELTTAMAGGIPAVQRRFSVQTTKGLIERSATNSEFSEFKKIVTSQNAEFMKKVEQETPGFLKQMNDGLAKHNADLSLSDSKIIPLPVHEETDRVLAYSALTRFNMTANGSSTPTASSVTATFVHVKGKILFLYAFAEEDGLEWSREASKKWADSVLAANPPDVSSSMRESLPPAVAAIDWGQVAIKGIIGAVVGMLIGLVASIIKRNKEKNKHGDA